MALSFKTTPFPHQQRELPRWDHVSRGLLWEMGTGKSWEDLMQGLMLHEAGKINGMFILAPNGVQRNWVVKEIPEHTPENILPNVRSHWYSGARHQSKDHVASLGKVMDGDSKHLDVLSMSYSSFMTDHGRKAAWNFLKNHTTKMTCDESLVFKSPGAKVTTRVLASAKYAKYRRILNGTPITNGPFDIYKQIEFLDENFWRDRGFGSIEAFRTTFAEYKPIKVAGGRTIQVVSSYKHLDMLKGYIDEICSRVTKDDVLDLPPKLFSVRTFDMTPEQMRVYRELEKDYITFIGENRDQEVAEELVLTRLLRLQQISCGYLPSDDDDKVVQIGKVNPRMETLLEMCAEVPHSAIIWSRFRPSIDRICEELKGDCVRYDGAVSEKDRGIAIDRFQSGQAKFFVANPKAAGVGLTLHRARTVIYESSDYELGKRLQSEDRAHRIGQMHPVQYIDMCAAGSRDEHIAEKLKLKLDVASQITGDKARIWLS